MKEIKERFRYRNIKTLHRFKRSTRIVARFKHQGIPSKHDVTERDESSINATVTAASLQSKRVVTVLVHDAMKTSAKISKRVVLHVQQHLHQGRMLTKDKIFPQRSENAIRVSFINRQRLNKRQEQFIQTGRSNTPTWRLRKPTERKPPLRYHRNQCEIRAWRRVSYTLSKPTFKGEGLSENKRSERKTTGTPPSIFWHDAHQKRIVESLNGKEIGRHLSRSATESFAPTKKSSFIKTRTCQSGKRIKTLLHSMKSATPMGREPEERLASAATQIRNNSIQKARQSVQRIATLRNSLQQAQSLSRFHIQIVRMMARLAAVLAKGLAAMLGVSGTVILILCVLMAVASIVSSPFGIFISDANTENGVQPLSHIVQELNVEFVTRLEEIHQQAGSVDRIEILYLGSADNTRIDNWRDVLAIFSVDSTLGSAEMDVVTLDAKRIEAIHSIFWDMNQIDYSAEMIEHEEIIVTEQEDGSSTEEKVIRYESVLHITITTYSAEHQADRYGFTKDQKLLVQEMLSEEFRPLMFTLLGQDPDTGLSREEWERVFYDLPEGEVGNEAVKLALTRLGDPYSQPKAGQDRYTDCSYLVQWVYRQVDIMLPRTAAEQGLHMVENGRTIQYEDLTPGDLVFWSYASNGRYMDITHVGIYAGDGKVVDASSTRGQVVYRNLFDRKDQVLYGRPG